MDYKIYYKNIEKKLEDFSDVVFYEPLSENDILKIEKQIGQTINPVYREFLLTFGFMQDVFGKLQTNVDTLFEDYNFLKRLFKNYIPIFCELDFEDTYYLINNNDIEDDYVYCVKVNNNDKISKLKKYMSFQRIIEESLTELKKDYLERTPNTEKVNNTEFVIPTKNYEEFAELCKILSLVKVSDWTPKYAPKNFFGDEVAKFQFDNIEIVVKKSAEQNEFCFEIEESILTPEEKSIILKTEKLLKDNGIEFKKNECRLI
jgi:hypothetical protein